MTAIPGLAAAVGAILAAWLLHWAGGFPAVVLATLAAFFAAYRDAPFAPHVARAGGQMLSLWALSGGLWFSGVAPHIFPYPGWIGAFIFFHALFFGLRRRLAPTLAEAAAGAIAAAAILISAAVLHGWLNP